MSRLFDLSGLTALVTGGGSGIGRAAALALAQHGAGVVVTSRREEPLLETADAIRQTGGKSAAVRGDVCVHEDRVRMVEEAVRFGGGIDILVNNAGINLRHPAMDFPEDDWARVLETNLTAPFQLSRLAAWGMADAGRGGSIINIASLLSEAARPGLAAYTAAKGGLKQLTKSLAVEWAPLGIRVNAVGPGYIRTDLNEPLIKDEKFNAWVLGNIPMKRWGEPEDLAGMIVYLASAASAYTTGQVFYIDGGWLAAL